MNTSIVTVEAINDDYEWIQYNDKLRIIHSIKDDMYQMQSIITACNSNKQVRHWFDNQSTKELLDEMQNIGQNSDGRILPPGKIYEKRINLASGLQGYYIHKLLVNHVAMWASPRYSIYIMKLLDDMFQKQREQLNNTIEEQKPRMVPAEAKNDYKYLIWKEEIPDNNQFVKLHLVRRHKDTFRQIHNKLKYQWFFRDNLPISMTPNREIKKLIKNNFGENDINMNCSVILCNKDCLDRLYELIENYFNKFQS